jgi:membrane peptidoglycan carboxypeptidase
MTKSIDTVFDKLAVDIDAQRVVDAVRRAGIPLDQQPTGDARIAFGDAQVRVLDIASAYATVAADGSRRLPHLVQKVTARDGRVLYAGPQLAGSNALPGQVARNVTESMLEVAATEGVALAAGRPAAAKSGTAQVDGQNTDAWFVGYTPQIATAVWVGAADGRGPILTRSDAPVYGRTLPGPIWQAFMNTALRGAPREEFSPFVPIGPV